MAELFVFKAGKYPQGDWPEERVKKLVDAYDPENMIEAPVVIGHRPFAMRDADQFAHGWVAGIRMDKDGKVYADIPEFSLEARHAIAEKKLRYISVELYEYDKVDEGQPPYLKAIALLGRDNPAVAGTRIPAMFSLATGGVVNTVDEESHVSTFTRKVSAEDVKLLSAEGQESNYQQEDIEMSKTVEEMQSAAELRTELEKSKAETAAFQKEITELKSAGKKQDAEAFFSKLREEGKLPPALFEKAVALDTRLNDEDRKEIRSLFSALETKVDLSGSHKADKKTAPASAASGAELTTRIRAYQKEHKLASFADAAAALYTDKPELFEEESND